MQIDVQKRYPITMKEEIKRPMLKATTFKDKVQTNLVEVLGDGGKLEIVDRSGYLESRLINDAYCKGNLNTCLAMGMEAKS